MNRYLWPLVIVALIGAGCGSSAPSETGSATSTASSTATAAAKKKKVSTREQGVKFAECVRNHGVPHMPDPNEKGEFVFGIDVSPEVWTKAVNACKDLEPPGALSSKRSPKQQSSALRFAQCMREHGVKDFPDPANGDPLIDTTHIPSSNRPGGMTILNAAADDCRDLVEEALRGKQ